MLGRREKQEDVKEQDDVGKRRDAWDYGGVQKKED